MRKVSVDEFMFIDAFERDVVFRDPYYQTAYLDLETGQAIWVFENDDDADRWSDLGI